MVLAQLRLARHSPALHPQASRDLDRIRAELLRRPGRAAIETEADFHLNIAATPYGHYLLPRMAPGCHGLPYDVVTVPLDQLARARS